VPCQSCSDPPCSTTERSAPSEWDVGGGEWYLRREIDINVDTAASPEVPSRLVSHSPTENPPRIGEHLSLLPIDPTAVSHPPLPRITDLTRPFWDGVASRRLMILQCQECGYLIHLPRPVCRRCFSTSIEATELSGRGTLYAYTRTLQAFHPFYVDKVPYVSAIVELVEQEGLKLTTILVDCADDSLRCGLAVEVTWTEAGPDWYLPYFRPGAEALTRTGGRKSGTGSSPK
jgi:uncharacterized protein